MEEMATEEAVMATEEVATEEAVMAMEEMATEEAVRATEDVATEEAVMATAVAETEGAVMEEAAAEMAVVRGAAMEVVRMVVKAREAVVMAEGATVVVMAVGVMAEGVMVEMVVAGSPAVKGLKHSNGTHHTQDCRFHTLAHLRHTRVDSTRAGCRRNDHTSPVPLHMVDSNL